MIDEYILIGNALNNIYQHTIRNKAEIELSTQCHCFCCKESFPSARIVTFVVSGHVGEKRTGDTAVCPSCGADSILGDASGFDVTPSLLSALHDFWFERKMFPDDFSYDWFRK